MVDYTAECWRDVIGQEGLYFVSNFGRVRGPKGRILRPAIDPVGRHSISISSAGRQRLTRTIHRLVLEAFVSTRPPGLVARHLNGNPADNRLVNLVWGTYSENTYDRVRHGTDHNASKTHCPQKHPYAGDNLYTKPDGTRVCRQCKNDQQRARRVVPLS
jgi:hypothetical protein